MFTPRTLLTKPIIELTLSKSLSTNATTTTPCSKSPLIRQLLSSRPTPPSPSHARSMATYRSRSPIRSRSQLKSVGPQGGEEVVVAESGSGGLSSIFGRGGEGGDQGGSGKNAFEAAGGWGKVAIAGGTVLGTIFVSNAVLNRETREALSGPERSHLNSTWGYTGLGLTILGSSAYALHRTGASYRIMAANPWLVMGFGLVGGIGSMIACRGTDPDNHITKLAFFSLFNLSQSVALAPLFFMHPALLARAGLYTLGVVGSLSFIGATAKQDKYLYLGGPLLAGVTVVALSSLAPMVLPVTAMRTLAVTEALSLYGGLAVFSGFMLYDTQRILAEARAAAIGLRKADPVGSAISLELNTLNIFIRMVQILSMQQRRK